ncbi:MAG TPA: 30S ribosomal protein S20 [Ignavibacteriales bacterium]|nr:30S ribosomal protein S20 [Ignavibacteriales bacterium]
MAHHKSAKKRIKVSEKRRVENKAATSKIKTLVKKVLTTEEASEVGTSYKEAVALIDKNVCKGRLHKNTAARRKSALTRHVNKLNSAAAPAPTAE